MTLIELVQWLTAYFFGNLWHFVQLLLLTFVAFGHLVIDTGSKNDKNEEQ